jgi:hypothetical protein
VVARRLRWGTGVGVVLAAVSGVLLGKLDGGWPWWLASAAVVVASAGLAMWLVPAGPPPNDDPGTGQARPERIGPGAIYAGGSLTASGDISTEVRLSERAAGEETRAAPGRAVDEGAIAAGTDISADGISTDVRIVR